MAKIKDYLIEKMQKENERLDREYEKTRRRKQSLR